MDNQTTLTAVIQAKDDASATVNNFGNNLAGITPIGVAMGAMLADLGEKFISFVTNSVSETMKLGEGLEFVRTNLDNLTGSSDKTNQVLGQMKDLVDSGIFKPEQVDQYT